MTEITEGFDPLPGRGIPPNHLLKNPDGYNCHVLRVEVGNDCTRFPRCHRKPCLKAQPVATVFWLFDAPAPARRRSLTSFVGISASAPAGRIHRQGSGLLGSEFRFGIHSRFEDGESSSGGRGCPPDFRTGHHRHRWHHGARIRAAGSRSAGAGQPCDLGLCRGSAGRMPPGSQGLYQRHVRETEPPDRLPVRSTPAAGEGNRHRHGRRPLVDDCHQHLLEEVLRRLGESGT